MNYDEFNEETKIYINMAMDLYSIIKEKDIIQNVKHIREENNYQFTKLDKKIYVRKIINNDELYDEMIYNHYYLQKPSELLESKHGICYDQVELIRRWFEEHNYEVITYFSSFHNQIQLILHLIR